MRLITSTVTWTLLGIFLMPSPRILDPERTHKRHATCEHHLKAHHPDPLERAKILRRAERRRASLEKRMREEQERQDAARMAEALDDSNLQPCQAAADPQDDDSRMKKGRRPAKIKTLFWVVQEPPRIRPTGDFLAMLRVHLEQVKENSSSDVETLPHYGSGPCHSIPRPREGTVLPPAPIPIVLV